MLEKSKYFTSHLSDVLRFLTLWKFGGIYLDMDMIVLKSLENFDANFACAESEVFVNAALLSLKGCKGMEFGEIFLK